MRISAGFLRTVAHVILSTSDLVSCLMWCILKLPFFVVWVIVMTDLFVGDGTVGFTFASLFLLGHWLSDQHTAICHGTGQQDVHIPLECAALDAMY